MFYFLISSYLLGSISSAIIICKVCNLPDPRKQGSKNPGATNVLRIGGKFAAVFVLIFDGLKGALPVIIANYYGYNLFDLTIILLCAFLGHVFPVYYRFKGGKGVATYLGGLIGISFFVGLTFSIIWLIVAKVMKVSSIAALTATVLSTISFFVEIKAFSFLIITVTFFLTSIMFAFAGFINAVFARTFDDISIIPNFVLLPLTYLSGMFYSIDILPSFWQALSAFNPIYYMMDAFRLGFLGIGTVELWKAFLVPVSMIMVLAIIANTLLNRGVSIKTE